MKEDKGIGRILSLLNISLSKEQRFLQKSTECVDVIKQYLEENENNEAQLIEKLAEKDLLIQELRDKIQHTKEKYKLKIKNLKENYEKRLNDEKEKNSLTTLNNKLLSSANIEPTNSNKTNVPKPCLVAHEKRPCTLPEKTDVDKNIESKKPRLNEQNMKITTNKLKTPEPADIKKLLKPCSVNLFQIEVLVPKPPIITNELDDLKSETPDLSLVKSCDSDGEEETVLKEPLVEVRMKDGEETNSLSETLRSSPVMFAKSEPDTMMSPTQSDIIFL